MLKFDLDALNAGSDIPLSTLSAAAHPGTPTDLVPLCRGTKSLIRTALPAILVLGSSGSAGVTTTALGLAAAAATNPGEDTHEPIVVDATAWGGDLVARGCDAAAPVSTVQGWLSVPQPGLPSAVAACTGRTSTGVRVLPRTPDPLPRRETYVAVQRHLETAGQLPVFDAGAPVTNQLIAPLISDPRVGLVLVVAARADAVNRLRPALLSLDERYGEFLISRTVIVVCQQVSAMGTGAAEYVRKHLGQWVRAVVPVPFDEHLASGGSVSWTHLEGETRNAYRLALGALQ